MCRKDSLRVLKKRRGRSELLIFGGCGGAYFFFSSSSVPCGSNLDGPIVYSLVSCVNRASKDSLRMRQGVQRIDD